VRSSSSCKVQSSRTEDVQLLSEDADEFVVLTKSSGGAVRPVRLSKRLVDGILPKNLTASRKSRETLPKECEGLTLRKCHLR
jgi:hypothetical protein